MTKFGWIMGAVCLAASAFMPAAAEDYALQISMKENGKEFAAPQIIVTPGVVYSVDMPPLDRYKLRVGVAPDAAKWTKASFGRELGDMADDFAFVITALDVRDPDEESGYKEIFKTNLLVLKTGRTYAAHVPVADFELKSVTGKSAVETLSINIGTTVWDKGRSDGVSVMAARNQLDTPGELPPQSGDGFQTPN